MLKSAHQVAEAFAPAKINLTLHVTGLRDDGFHTLDSLVVFADVGDRIFLQPSDETTLSVTGPRAAGVPADGSNLVVQAVMLMGASAEITLQKQLPPAAGIGGGSSDAAATLRALAKAFDQPLPPPQGFAILGADVPVCVLARPTRMSGIGAQLDDLPDLPPLYMVLVNPGVAVTTPKVFAALENKVNAPMPVEVPKFSDAPDFARWLATQRNDLELPARAMAPAIGVVLSRIAQTDGCLLSRMSGSGATCFGLYASRTEADMARDVITQLHPDWWVKSASTWTF